MGYHSFTLVTKIFKITNFLNGLLIFSFISYLFYSLCHFPRNQFKNYSSKIFLPDLLVNHHIFYHLFINFYQLASMNFLSLTKKKLNFVMFIDLINFVFEYFLYSILKTIFT